MPESNTNQTPPGDEGDGNLPSPEADTSPEGNPTEIPPSDKSATEGGQSASGIAQEPAVGEQQGPASDRKQPVQDGPLPAIPKDKAEPTKVENKATTIKENTGIVAERDVHYNIFRNDYRPGSAEASLAGGQKANPVFTTKNPNFKVSDLVDNVVFYSNLRYDIRFGEVSKLMESRMAVIESIDEQMLVEAGQRVARELHRAKHKCLQVDIDSGDELLDNTFTAKSFAETYSEVPTAIFFHVRNGVMQGFASRTLGAGAANLKPYLQQKEIVFVFLIYSGFTIPNLRDCLLQTDTFRWELDALEIQLLKHFSVEKTVNHIHELQRQRQSQLWSQDPFEFYNDVRRELQKNGPEGLEKLINDRENTAYSPQVELGDELRVLLKKPCHQAILFLVSYLPGIPVTVFNKVLNILLIGKKQKVQVKKHTTSKEGKVEEQIEEQFVEANEFLLQNRDDIWEECSIGLFPNQRGSLVVEFDGTVIREQLRRQLQSQPITFDGFQKIYSHKILFDPELPDRSVRFLVDYFASMFPQFAEETDQGWLRELTDFSKNLVAALDEFEREKLQRTDDMDGIVEWFRAYDHNRNLSSFLISRIAELCRAIIRNTSAGDVTKLLGSLIDSRDEDIAIQISTRLRYEEGFDILEFFSQILCRGKSNARNAAIGALLSESSQSIERCLEVLDRLEEWRNKDDEHARWNYAVAFVPIVSRKFRHALAGKNAEKGPFEAMCEFRPSFREFYISRYRDENLNDSLSFVLQDEIEAFWGFRGAKDAESMVNSILADALADTAEVENENSPFYNAVEEIIEGWEGRDAHKIGLLWRERYRKKETSLRNKRSLSKQKRQRVEAEMKAIVLLAQRLG
tara:strand:- start:4365 stop:6929 length:2565 start_codon:yes stop_codon:yes gene_type:complete